MSYSTLMVHLDIEGSNDKRLGVAAQLAERFNSRVIGVTAGNIQPLYFLDGDAAQTFLEKDRALLGEQFGACEKQFRSAFASRVDRIEWRCAIESPGPFVAREARAADLIIVGSKAGAVDPLRCVNPAELVLNAGRPTMVVPDKVEWLKHDSILVAWKDTREARRAINDALPLLHQAKGVVVLELVEESTDREAAEARVKDVAAWLARRGIQTSSIVTKALVAVPDQLAMLAQDEGANVIVAGAYGHTRFQEWVFGGVTRGLLQQQKCAMLLSH